MDTLQDPRRNAEHGRPLADLVALVDLPALVERYSGQGRRSGGSFTYRCPNPQHPDSTPSFTVSKDKRGRWRASCWSQCAWHGDALDLVRWLDGCDVPTGANKLRAFLGLPTTELWVPPTPKRPAPKREHRPTPLPTETRTPDADTCQDWLARYLRFRGWPAWVVAEFGLRVVLDDRGRVRVRHTFYGPTENDERVVLAYQDRALKGVEPKWIGPKGVPLPLFNLPALGREVNAAVICEGPADTISATVALRSSAHLRVAAVGVAGVNGWRAEWAHLFAGLTVVTAADSDKAGDTLRATVERDLAPVADTLRHLKLPESCKDLTDWCDRRGFAGVGDDLGAVIGRGPVIESDEYLARWVALLTEAGLNVEVQS